MDHPIDPRTLVEMYLSFREVLEQRLVTVGYTYIEERSVLTELENEVRAAFGDDKEMLAAMVASIGFEQLWEIEAYRASPPATGSGIV